LVTVWRQFGGLQGHSASKSLDQSVSGNRGVDSSDEPMHLHAELREEAGPPPFMRNAAYSGFTWMCRKVSGTDGHDLSIDISKGTGRLVVSAGVYSRAAPPPE
jgi:hypothetical protein